MLLLIFVDIQNSH